MKRIRRTGLPVSMGLVLLAAACGGGSDSNTIAKALETKKAPAPVEASDKPTSAPKPAAVDEKAAPWTVEDVRKATQPGLQVVYARSGTDAKGKKAGGELTYVVRGATDESAATSYTIEPDPGTNLASSQVAKVGWSKLGPFFAMEKPEVTVTGREQVTVPAGTFTTSVAEVRDFFGNEKTFWMIVDQPGVFAKVVDRGNASDDADKTEITYELVSVQR